MQLPVFASAPHPVTRESVSYFLDHPLRDVQRFGGPAGKVGDLRTAGRVLCSPWQVRERPGLFAIVGRPTTRFLDAETEVPAESDQVFVVEVTHGMCVVACDWIGYRLQYPALTADVALEHFLTELGREVQHAA